MLEGPKKVGPEGWSEADVPRVVLPTNGPRAPTSAEIEPGALTEILAVFDRDTPLHRPPFAASSARPKVPKIGTGPIVMEPGVSSPAMEKALRAGLYWTLVNRCRADDGALLPPDAIDLTFTIEAAGTIARPSIVAKARDKKHDAAAECVRREVAAADFRGPPPENGMATRLSTTVPSVD